MTPEVVEKITIQEVKALHERWKVYHIQGKGNNSPVLKATIKFPINGATKTVQTQEDSIAVAAESYLYCQWKCERSAFRLPFCWIILVSV